MSTILLFLTATLLLLMLRIVFLLRTHGRLQNQCRTLQETIVAQHQDVITARQDGNAWRGLVQGMMEGFRADLTRRTDAANEHSRALDTLRDSFSETQVVEKTATTAASPARPFIPLPSLS